MKRKHDEFVDLHVAVVPQKHWNQQLNHASHKVLTTKISAGFIRVARESTVHSLRKEISKQIGLDKLYADYVFLRNVAECLVLVHRKQEDILKSADFAPPTIDYPELLILPVAAPQQSTSSQAYSNRSSIQHSDDSPRTSVNRPTTNESANGSVTVTESDFQKETPTKGSVGEPKNSPYLQPTRPRHPHHNVTSDIKDQFNNGILEKLDPDGQSSVRSIVRSGSSHMNQDGAGRDSIQSSRTGRSPEKEFTVSAHSRLTSRLNQSEITDPVVRTYEDPIANDAYLSDLRDRQGSGSSSVGDDFSRKSKHSRSSHPQFPQNDASNHESPHSSKLAYFIKSTVNKSNKTDSPALTSQSPETSHAKYSVNSHERGERNDDDNYRLNDESGGHSRFSESRDFGRVSTGRRTDHSDGVSSGNSPYDQQYPYEFPKLGSETNIHPGGQNTTQEDIPANSRKEMRKSAADGDSNMIPLPLIIRKSEKVNAVTYESQNPRSDDSEDGDEMTIRDSLPPSQGRLQSSQSRYSVSNFPDLGNAEAISPQLHSANLKIRLQQTPSLGMPSSHSESNDLNLTPTRVHSNSSQQYYSDIPDDPKPPPATTPTRHISEDSQLQLYDENESRQPIIAGQSPSYYDESGIAQGYRGRRSSAMLDPPSSHPSTSPSMHSRQNSREYTSGSHRNVASPRLDFEHQPVRVPTQSPDLRLPDESRSPTSNERHEIITNFIINENISTSIPKVGLQPISRGTPDGTHVSRRPNISSETVRKNKPSSIRTYAEKTSDIAENSYVVPHGGSDFLPPFQNDITTTNQASHDRSEISSEPSQGHKSASLDYPGPQDAKAHCHDESQTRKEFDENTQRRTVLWQDLRKIRERRERLEEIRQITIKEARVKAAMISRKRDGSQDVWKRRHHEEKKVTDSLTKFYQALEIQCNNLNQKTKTIDNVPSVYRKRNTMRTTYTDERPSFKKNSELQAKRIITQINDMKSRLAEVKAKLAAEIKVRHDIEQELKAMRKGLLSKKIQSNLAFRRINHYEELIRSPKGIPRRRFRKY